MKMNQPKKKRKKVGFWKKLGLKVRAYGKSNEKSPADHYDEYLYIKTISTLILLIDEEDRHRAIRIVAKNLGREVLNKVV